MPRSRWPRSPNGCATSTRWRRRSHRYDGGSQYISPMRSPGRGSRCRAGRSIRVVRRRSITADSGCGSILPLRRRVAVWAFVMVLSCSRHLFVRPVIRMDQTTWCACHVAAFEFFGAVPARLVCDNLKTGVDKPDLYDPQINRTYAELARPLRHPGRPGARVQAQGQTPGGATHDLCAGLILARSRVRLAGPDAGRRAALEPRGGRRPALPCLGGRPTIASVRGDRT